MKKLKKFLSLVLTLAMLVTLVPSVTAFAATQPTTPSDGTVSGCPFVKGTADSNSFRIPSMVTLSDGTLVAAADARWNTTYDGGCGDTIVARSSDNGSTWKYTFANYLGDNGNSYSGSGSTCFIDPALAVDSDDTIYMLVDLYPYGVALNGSGNTNPSTSVGFNSDNTLKLSADGSNYNYYLKDGKIYNSSNTEVSGYTVDGKFNVYQNGTYVSNLFFSDSPYKVVRTGYLYLTKSTDKGASWSDPLLIPNVKTTSEQACLVGPGRGNVLSDGTIMFPVYSYNSGSQECGFIYSTDNGATWNRSYSGITNWSSEAAIVELSSSKLRVFYRNGNERICYVDVTKNGNSYSWGSAVTTGVACNSNTQLSAIKVTSGGADYILVSCPGNESSSSSASNRTNGQIVTFKASDMTKVQTASVPSVHTTNSFMYSCLSQLSNGNVAILYEDQENQWGTGSSCYYQMSFKTYTLSELGISSDAAVTYTYSVTCKDSASTTAALTVGDTVEVQAAGTASDGSAVDLSSVTWSSSDSAVASISANGSSAGASSSSVTGASATVTAKAAGTAVITAFLNGASIGTVTVTVNAAAAEQTQVSVDLKVGESKTYTADSASITTQPDTGIAEASVEAGQAEGYTAVTSITSGKKYLLAVNTSHVLTTASSSNDWKINGYTTTSASVSSGTISGTSYDNYLWTITKTDSGYTLMNASGQYLAINEASPDVKDWGTNYPVMTQSDPYYFTINAASGTITSVNNSNISLNNFGGANSCVAGYTGASTITFYEQNTSDNTLTITGLTQGNTSLTVGNTVYNITVTANEYQETKNAALGKSITLNPTLPTGGSASYSVTSGSSLITLSGTTSTSGITVTAGSTTGTAVVTAVVKAANGNTYATYRYTIMISDLSEITHDAITIDKGASAEISVDLESGQTVEWSSADTSIASVSGVYDQTAEAYGGAADVVGTEVSAEGTTITGTVKDSDGNIVARHYWPVTVTQPSGTQYTATMTFEIQLIEHCTIYYCINGGELVEINDSNSTVNTTTGYRTLSLTNTSVNGTNIMFFAKPDDGYALTYMYSGTGYGDYYCLSDGNPDGTGSGAWPFESASQSEIPEKSDDSAWKDVTNTSGSGTNNHGFRWSLLEGELTIATMKNMFTRAIALGCDGALTFTKSNGDATITSDLKFAAQELPKVEKKISKVGGKTYTAGTSKVNIGDTIEYEVTVTRYATNATYGTITYSNEALYDKMTNGDTTLMASGTMGTSTTSDQTYSYTTSITLTMDNFAQLVSNGTITNTVDFTYSYKSTYSNGTLSSSASVTADQIDVVVPEYVIDFGSPVTITVDSKVLGTATITGGTAAYGTIKADGTSFTYTPYRILAGRDSVTLTLSNGQSYGVNIYPATTVYYEEGFASGTWIDQGAKGSTKQTTSLLGANADGDNYGYDSSYSAAGAASGAASNNTSETSTTGGDQAEFTFTGTGVDIYATCTKSSGQVAVGVKDSEGTMKKIIMVDTASVSGSSDLTTYPSGNLYNVPIVSVSGLDHDTYTVSLIKMGTAEVTLDGFKVYNTIDPDDSSVYAGDLEDNPSFIEVRDLNFGTINLSAYGSEYTSDVTEQIYKKVTETENVTALLTSTAGASVAASTDLIDNGPKNEIYLYPGMTLTLNIKTTREVQIGLRGLQGSRTCTIGTTGQTVSTTDMFYTVKAKTSDSGEKTITITNPADDTADATDNIIAVTKLKVCDAPDAVCQITEENIEDTLAVIDGTAAEAPENPEEPEEPVVEYTDAVYSLNLVDYTGSTLATATLTENGAAGEEAVFAAADIQAAAEAVLPSGYAFADESVIGDAAVIYGENGSADVLIGKVATLKITYKKGFKTVGTAVLTHIQTSSATKYTFTTSEIKAAAPSGCKAISLWGTSVKYGSTGSITATCR